MAVCGKAPAKGRVWIKAAATVPGGPIRLRIRTISTQDATCLPPNERPQKGHRRRGLRSYRFCRVSRAWLISAAPTGNVVRHVLPPEAAPRGDAHPYSPVEDGAVGLEFGPIASVPHAGLKSVVARSGGICSGRADPLFAERGSAWWSSLPMNGPRPGLTVGSRRRAWRGRSRRDTMFRNPTAATALQSRRSSRACRRYQSSDRRGASVKCG
jgi:hypothetical protein